MKVTCPFCEDANELSRAVHPESELTVCAECNNPCLVIQTTGGAEAVPLPGWTDIRVTAPAESLGGQLLAGVKNHLDDLPLLPEISRRVMEVVADDDSGMADLADVISEDAILAAKILQVSNSALYGGLSEITGLQNACARLGMKTVANTVHSIAQGKLYQSDDKALQEVLERLWRHSVATAYLCSQIAELVSEDEPDVLYLMGLMHDVGKVALVHVMSASKNGVLGELREKQELFGEITRNFHPLIGLHVMKKWKLPADFSTSVFWHGAPNAASSEHWQRWSHIVSLANVVAHVAGYPSEYRKDVALLTHPSAAYFSLTDIKLATLRVDVEEKMDELLEAMS